LGDRSQATLAGSLASSGDGSGVHGGSPLRFGVTAVISRSSLLQLAPNSQQAGRCGEAIVQQRPVLLDETLERASNRDRHEIRHSLGIRPQKARLANTLGPNTKCGGFKHRD